MLTCLAASIVWAQESPVVKVAQQPAKPPRVTRILFSVGAGMCYGYCFSELDVEPGGATLLNQSRQEDKNQCPDIKVRTDLSDKHWKELVQLIDRQALIRIAGHDRVPRLR